VAFVAAESGRAGLEERIRLLIGPPALTRRLYPRGGFEGLEPNTLQVLLAVS
jgi:hypothetical protein